jgi:hypothetical protein
MMAEAECGDSCSWEDGGNLETAFPKFHWNMEIEDADFHFPTPRYDEDERNLKPAQNEMAILRLRSFE